MRVLLTNDDGIGASGLAALGRALVTAGHTLVVVAPARELSGSGTSLGTIESGAVVGIRAVTIEGVQTELALAIDGPPALAVHAAMGGAFGPVPEVVAVGVNPGFNTGVGTLYSSTVGAAVAAVALGCPAVAVSCRAGDPTAFDVAAAVAAEAVAAVAAEDSPVALNINVASTTPRREALTLVPLAARGLWHLEVERERDGVRLLPGWHTTAEEGTDAGVVVDGGIAVTVLSGRFATVDDRAAATAARRLAARLPGDS